MNELSNHPQIEKAIAYFEARIEVDWETGCLNWTGNLAPNGYGRINTVVFTGYAFHFIDNYTNGPIPEGYDRHHKCKNRRCASPFHIERLTRKEHRRVDVVARGNCCPYGHPYTEDNLHPYYLARGKLKCLICYRTNNNRTQRQKTASIRRFLANRKGPKE